MKALFFIASPGEKFNTAQRLLRQSTNGDA